LLEVMVALAILGMSVTVLMEIVTNNVRATNHAKLTTAGTFLARGKMVDLEDDIIANGFTDSDENASGNFKDRGYEHFRWESSIERIELPSDLAQKTRDQAKDQTDSADSSKDPMSMVTGMMGGMMSSFIEPVRVGLQESVRKVTVRVFWDEVGRSEQSIDVVQYLTDPSKLDLAMAAATGLPGVPGMPGMPGAPGGMPGMPTPGSPALNPSPARAFAPALNR
jgi:general secretion pathway protein I